MAGSKSIGIAALLLALLCIQPASLQLQKGDSATGLHCNEEEWEALLDFKRGLEDPGNRLSSWSGEDHDCCQWEGVGCNNRTGRVELLHLRCPRRLHFDDLGLQSFDSRWCLGGEIRPSLLALTHLKHLDLSLNDFGGIRIPRFLGSFKELRYLNLSAAGFGGRVPPELGNLSTLRHLDLSCGNLHLDFSYHLEVENTRWLSRLTSLLHLDMNFVMFQNASWLQALNMLPSILEIRLSHCQLQSLPPSPSHVNFTSLSVLDLSSNGINSTIPEWLFSVTSLTDLDLSGNEFLGLIPAAIGNMASLEFLDLSDNPFLEGELPKTLGYLCNLHTLRLSGVNVSEDVYELREIFSGCMRNTFEELTLDMTNLRGRLPDWLGDLRNLRVLNLLGNQLHGSIPASLGRLTSLQSLKLSDNKLNGSVPESLGKLSKLGELDLSSNNWEGVLSEAHFMNLTKLKSIDISGNPLLALKVSSGWNPPFRLDVISMSSCQLGPQFPAWLRTQENYTSLYMSEAGISDTMPDWFWDLSMQFNYLDLSQNKIGGKVQYLTSNRAFELDLSDNLFSGPIPPSLWEAMPNLMYLSLSMNRLNGTIPLSVCRAKRLVVLDLSNNRLSGELPKCWQNSSALFVLDLSNNSLSGGLSGSLCTLRYLESIHLSNNFMSGELSFSLWNCTKLVVLELSQNKFSGIIPPWIGQRLSSLNILSLHSNMLSGSIPSQLSDLDALQILDLSHNDLSGFIPQSFGNFSAMNLNHQVGNPMPYELGYQESLMLSIKGIEIVYGERLLSLVMTIDLSNNGLSGSIPEEIGNLIGLESLNLSGNQLSGEIIEKLGEMRQLESLDLSRNMLSGGIPSSLSNLYALSHLNLSYNNLSGRIPTGEQLQTLDDPSIYIGNHDLCGPPLMKKCPDDETPPMGSSGFGDNMDNEGGDEMVWFYSGMAPGFAVGFLAIFVLLALKKTWRISYLRFIDNMYDILYVAVEVSKSKLKGRVTRREN